MSKNLNRVELMGYLACDPVLLTDTESGNPVCFLTVYTHKTFFNKKGEKVQTKESHNVSVFGDEAINQAKYLKVGAWVRLDGSLHYKNEELPVTYNGVVLSINGQKLTYWTTKVYINAWHVDWLDKVAVDDDAAPTSNLPVANLTVGADGKVTLSTN